MGERLLSLFHRDAGELIYQDKNFQTLPNISALNLHLDALVLNILIQNGDRGHKGSQLELLGVVSLV